MHWHDLRLIVLADDLGATSIARPLHAAGDLLSLADDAIVAVVPAGTDPPHVDNSDPSVVFVSMSPMTETVKEVRGAQILHTIDRETLYVASFPIVTSGVVLSAAAGSSPAPDQLIEILISGRWPVRSLAQDRP
ncbi:hypothetical protein CLV47_103264 [Antricoccus suffuscus]|uniref:Uncharacterized protein n=1 Tax=Antricoccus suffuscus TaxID=1629062 RepID=A0A2T1A3P0_9ACTN|nr:hypothetical protein [Antricoccus suffuscus]PRZ43206.1 hypothetical protein CLV47_103264 [Antricoccus suffuscus]